MKVAMTVWEETLSTVCDFCSALLLVDIEGQQIQGRLQVPFYR
jgi:hypothetical protein